jgi:ribosomal protein S18 acetylase RimI-like enzyme
MTHTEMLILPLTTSSIAHGPQQLHLETLAAEWRTRGEFWSFRSCLESMTKMDAMLSAAATLQAGGPWIGWYLATCQSDTCELLYIYTAEASRGQRVAGQLLDDLIARATEAPDIDAIFLEVRPSNQAAIRLYESKGFKNISCRKRYYSNGDDALVYQRPIIRL